MTEAMPSTLLLMIPPCWLFQQHSATRHRWHHREGRTAVLEGQAKVV